MEPFYTGMDLVAVGDRMILQGQRFCEFKG